MKYRKRPVVVEAQRWTGGEYAWLNDFCGQNWSRADVHDMAFPDPEQVIVYNTAEHQWLHVPVGHWIVRGVQGELYPCKPDIFAATYQPSSESESSPESPAKEQPEEQIAAPQESGSFYATAVPDPYGRTMAGGMLGYAAQAGHSLSPAPSQEGHDAGPVAAPDVAAMVKRLRDPVQMRDRDLIDAERLEAAALIEKLGHGWIPVSSGKRPEHYPFVVRWNDETATNTCDRYEAIDHQGLDWSYATHWIYLPPPPERP